MFILVCVCGVWTHSMWRWQLWWWFSNEIRLDWRKRVWSHISFGPEPEFSYSILLEIYRQKLNFQVLSSFSSILQYLFFNTNIKNVYVTNNYVINCVCVRVRVRVRVRVWVWVWVCVSVCVTWSIWSIYGNFLIFKMPFIPVIQRLILISHTVFSIAWSFKSHSNMLIYY